MSVRKCRTLVAFGQAELRDHLGHIQEYASKGLSGHYKLRHTLNIFSGLCNKLGEMSIVRGGAYLYEPELYI